MQSTAGTNSGVNSVATTHQRPHPLSYPPELFLVLWIMSLQVPQRPAKAGFVATKAAIFWIL